MEVINAYKGFANHRIVWLFILSVFSPSLLAAQDKVIELTATNNWYPYVYYDSERKVRGSDYTILKNLLNEMGYQLRASTFPERRMGRKIEQGDIEVVLGAAKNSVRSRNNTFSLPYRKETITFAYLKKHQSAYADKSLLMLLDEGHMVAINKSGWYGEWFADNVIKAYPKQIVHVESVNRRLNLVNQNRVELIVDDRQVLKANAKLLNVKNLIISETPINVQDVHFMFSKRAVTKDFMREFNAKLAEFLLHNTPL
ncbi:transporter substrate-binding domain-containing protein [Alteromonas pelagimontana]|uniref:Transporter substrate-binding domain-containing protein n=1 Tax=Alteromonas pelagimontana TaxID=1858656 RepID=A0A6M4MAQ5_9ALTE|nr:transporter substrate-binding domain-containing protein [Alteromonas pelagimontana]QJR80253.1 transporter substrate-binding domain-containing protein [Alteromonas pelagimontana]